MAATGPTLPAVPPSASTLRGRLEALIDKWIDRWRPQRVMTDVELSAHVKSQFESLLVQEGDALYNCPGWNSARPDVKVPASGEPWVAKATSNYVGLALSGGGIRSATFNLGLLQGLDRLGLLDLVAYLSTVSGGGYTGGFWSAWLTRPATAAAPNQPVPPHAQFPGGAIDGSDPSRVEDTPELRHLREFSRFLSPRIGFFETEMWHAVLAFAGGLIPTLIVSLSLIALTLIAWLGFTTYLAAGTTVCGAFLTFAIAAIVLERLERSWSRHADLDTLNSGLRAYLICALVGLGVTTAAFWALHATLDRWQETGTHLQAAGLNWHIQAGGWTFWRDGLFLVEQGRENLHAYLRVFETALAWTAAGVTLLVGRLFVTSLTKPAERAVRSNALDRVIMRFFGLALIWALIAVLWHLGVIVSRAGWGSTATAIAAMLSGGLFGALRNWLTTAFSQTGHRGFIERARPFLPMLLAYLTIGLGIVWVATLLAWWLDPGQLPAMARTPLQWWLPWILAVVILTGVLGVVLALDPADYSLHAFYRDRIARAYLGASNPQAADRAADNRNAEIRPDDDLKLSSLPDRPLHLVCCAANDLSGDQVETLSRGSRSVTLSKHGVAIGGLWGRAPELTLGAALTASAAAFNSVMGSVSKKLGPAVTFLMSALNLRLGIWIRHPGAERDRIEIPGRSLLREMFGKTNAGLARDGMPEAPTLHLSDGAHFDNLGLYELVRRHCRYIIVSDCGADADSAYDDLGSAVRRIREDFGVEIEIDLTPLKATDSTRATQHAVVGTVHYDRQFDKGILVYFKPTLVGEEPPDVLQYHTRNTAFPHEGTIDQFYDEAQWESYRRLGFHSALVCFRFAERLAAITADAVFIGARQQWFPTSKRLQEEARAMADRFGALEADLREDDQAELLGELLPEARVLSGHRPKPQVVLHSVPPKAREEPVVSTATKELATVMSLLKAMEAMEDIWINCELDTQWKHPLNVGWVNMFARWATAPSFRRWWPVLAPCFSDGFQRFLREQFFQSEAANLPPRGEIQRFVLSPADPLPEGLATSWWTDRMKVAPNSAGRVAYQYCLRLAGLPDPLQVGLVLVSETQEEGRPLAAWTSEDFFVPPSLWGGRLGRGFLEELLKNGSPLGAHGFDTVDVHVVSRRHERSAAYREERISFVEFYRAAGFQTTNCGTRETATPDLLALLARRADDLDAWTTMRWWREP